MVEKFLLIYEKFLKVLTKLVGVIAGALVMYCAFSIVWEVIARGVLNSPTEWVMEISTYCILIAGFLGMGVAYAGKKHIHVDIFVSQMSPKMLTYVEVFTSLLGIFYSYIFTVYSWDMAMLSLELNNDAGHAAVDSADVDAAGLWRAVAAACPHAVRGYYQD